MIIVLCGSKGGLGKSTLTIAIACELHARGLRVLIVDADDEQRTSLTWSEVAAEVGADVPQVVVMGDNIITALPPMARAYDVVLVDCPGGNRDTTKRTSRALGTADFALLPCGPTGPEIWALPKTCEQVQAVQDLRPFPAYILVCRKQPGTVLGRRARAAIEEAPLPLLDTELDYRITYGEMTTGGQGLHTYEPKSEAAEEVRRLVDELSARMGIDGRKKHVKKARSKPTSTEAAARSRRSSGRPRRKADRPREEGGRRAPRARAAK